MGRESESIAKTVQRHSELPVDSGTGANADLPKLFGFPIPEGEKVVDDVPLPHEAGRIRGIPKYNFKAHYKRFVMGYVEIGRDERGQPIMAMNDDSPEYEALLDEFLEGKAMLRWEDRNTLKDGTVVVSVCYMTPKPKKEANQT